MVDNISKMAAANTWSDLLKSAQKTCVVLNGKAVHFLYCLFVRRCSFIFLALLFVI